MESLEGEHNAGRARGYELEGGAKEAQTQRQPDVRSNWSARLRVRMRIRSESQN